MKTRTIITTIILLLLTVSRVNCSIQFNHFNIHDGLSNNSVRWIYQDKKGFLWFGTLNGLNRFDGKQFKTYPLLNEGYGNSTNNCIIQIAEDSDQFLWVTTNDKKVNALNVATNKTISFPFQVYPHNSNYKRSSVSSFIKKTSSGAMWLLLNTGGCVRCLYNINDNNFSTDTFNYQSCLINRDMNFVHQDKSGGVWLGTKKGLTYLPNDTINFDSDKVQHYFYEKSIGFTTFYEFKNEIWFGTIRHGIIKYNLETNQFSSSENKLTGKGIISSINADKKGNVLIGTMRDGIFFFNKDGNLRHFTRGNNGLKSPHINEIYCTSSGLFWFMTHLRGVTMFDPKKEHFTHFPLSPNFREKINEPERIQFFEDSKGQLWIGNYGGGLFRYHEAEQRFEHFYYNESNPGSLSSNFILSIFEDNSNNIWIGTLNGGINKVSYSPNYFTNVKPDPSSPLKYTNEVRALWSDSIGRTWIGTKGGVLFCYNSQMKEIWNSKQSSDLKSLITSGIYCINGDSKGNLWIGTKGNGVIVIKEIIHEFTNHLSLIQFQSESGKATNISNNNVYCIHEDHLGQIWIGNYFGGLNLLTNPFSNPTFQHFRANSNQLHQLTDDRVRCIFQDKDRNLWIGTVEGLNFLPAKHLNSDEKMFIPVPLNNLNNSQVLSNDILTINQCEDGKIRVGTFGGGLFILEDMNIDQNRFNWVNYTAANGLSGDVVNSMTNDDNGELWITTDKGLSKLNRKNNEFDTFSFEETIGTNNIFSENGCCITSDNKIVFGTSNGIVSFNPDSIIKENSHYPLVVTNFKLFDEYVSPGNNSTLSKSIELTRAITLNHNQNFFAFEFSTLDYRDQDKIHYQYILENFEKSWVRSGTNNEAVYKNIAPGYYIFKVKSTNASNIWNDKVVEITIRIKNPFWKTPWAYFIYIVAFIGLISLIIYIITQQFKLKNRVALEQKITEDKIRFYTNISHEFKTPLTLILGPADKLLNDTQLQPKTFNQVNLIKQNALRLFELIDQLLEFRKVQKGARKLNISKINIVEFCTRIYENFVPVAQQKQILFELIPCNEQEVWLDKSCIEKILFNLLSNAFKNTDNGKRIRLNVDIDNTETCILSVIDEGIGIKPENLTEIFERFSFIAKSPNSIFSSSGIGLSFTKELVELHKGEVTVVSNYGTGSTFSVKIPCSKKHYSENDFHEVITESSEINNITDALSFSLNNETENHLNQPNAHTKPLLLIIEDDDQLRHFIADSLAVKYRIKVAEEGFMGIKLAKSESPDLVISDVIMPNKDGFAITKELKSDFETCHIPVILLTGQTADDQKIKGLENGADDYITKPFSMKYLTKRVENILNQRKILKEKFISEPGIKPDKLTNTKQDQAFIAKVIQLTEEHMSSPDFSIDSIIKEMGHGRTLFYKKMKTISGYAPREFIMIVRMKKAAELLRETNITIKVVSEDVGYYDTNHFSKNFKNYFGELPSEYRKKFAINNDPIE